VIKTNILGTENIIEAAEECGVKKVVVISSDKATKAENCYGSTKYIAEKLARAHVGKTTVVCLRYGNVLGSRGSVVPLFLDQIRRNIPLTITHYDMSRFLVSLDQAISLSLRCLNVGENGELIVMKPPACTIRSLVDALELYYNHPLPQTVIGIRGGEKLAECLITGEESYYSKIEEENGVTYVRIPSFLIANFITEGRRNIFPKDFTSLDAEQLNPQQVLTKLKEAKLL
jgi:UDP-glucose 4-epimerase